MRRVYRILFAALVLKPVALLLLGIHLRGREKLPGKGPAVIAANHNSHLDTLVLLSLYPLGQVHRLRPVAAADYFLRNRALAWLSLNCLGVIPLDRSGAAERRTLFAECHRALDSGDILIVFPEGSRGEPERLGELRKGLFHLIKDRPDTVVTPVVMRGLGYALPRGEALLVPSNCDVIVGDRLAPAAGAEDFVVELKQAFEMLSAHCITRHGRG